MKQEFLKLIPGPASMTDPLKGNKQEIEILNQAFQAFNKATHQLQTSYDELKGRIKALDLELAEKNEALEQNLKEKEEVKNYLNNILESLTSGVIVVNREGKITTFNKTAGAITGLPPNLCLGKPLQEVFDPDLVDTLLTRLKRSNQRMLNLDRELATGNDRKVHVRLSASPVSDPSDRRIGTVLIIQDITELKRLEEEANRNDRLRATGEMAAGIAHEIRNPLGSIELFASLLKNDLEGDEDKKKLVEHISASVKNMDRIISSVLLFAKSPQPSRQKCDVNELLQELINGPGHIMVPDNIKTVCRFDSGSVTASGDSGLLKQVFLNLIRNGIQAMPDGGELILATGNSHPSAASNPDPSDHRGYITLTIADTGEGIPSDRLEKIFDPFFTTKDKGTGLGLSISHNIIKAHQGTIDAESEVGKGTVFTLKIPGWDEELDEKQFQ